TPCHVDVECAGTFTRGMTVVDLDHVGPGEPNAQVAVDVDAARFRALLLERVIGLDAALSNEN
ncbi:MAG: nucleoside hydrolase, partial [Actinomycetales bacterium]